MKQSGIILQKDIYESSVQALLRVITTIDKHLDFIALFGHNPGLTNLADILCDRDMHHIPTSGMVMISFPFDDWSMVSAGTGELIFFDYPKDGL